MNCDSDINNDILEDDKEKDVINIPKKRGRKPKAKLAIENKEPIVKKKRGRKPSGKIFENTDVVTPLMSECIIAHLPLSEKDIRKITGEQVEVVKPVSVIAKRQINFSLESESDLKHMLNEKTKELEELKKKYDELDEKYNKYSYLETIVTDNGIIDKKYYVPNDTLISEDGEIWKEKTDLWCSWCVHPFTTVPIGLPEMYCQKTKKFFTRECFCSFNCAHAFNLSLGDYKVWERYALLSRIKNQVYKNGNLSNKSITYAPPRQVLKEFNGDKTIEEFRNNSISIPKEYVSLLPPSIPFFTVVEEIPKFFQQNKLNTNFNKLKLKRSKPLPMKKNNLMNLFDK